MAATAAQDRLFLFGLVVSTFVTIRLMRRMLLHYRDDAILPPSEAKPQYITQDVEDSLKLSTLNKLLDSPNYSIQETTAVIICERALHDTSTLDALLFQITRPDHDTREQGIRAFTMILNNANIGKINLPKVYAALIKCLEYCVTDYEHNEFDVEWDNWPLRDVVEQGCLVILFQLVDKFGVEGLVKSKFVDRWLVKEPWGGADEEERQINFMKSLTKEHRLTQICLPLWKAPTGRQQLEAAKLLPSSKYFEGILETTPNTTIENGEDATGEGPSENRRRRDQSSEEEHLRRRHREAMVLNDSSRPLGPADIIERAR